MSTRRRFSGNFEAKMALEALRRDKTIRPEGTAQSRTRPTGPDPRMLEDTGDGLSWTAFRVPGKKWPPQHIIM